ncbi:hypothetical protein ABZ626_21340 [Streptomyces longispororuber]|uniref:hypothetical protein n=1 Tax=Streptomyces longispororuber TaxID=68230 RepID=UPI0033C5AC95
MPRTNRWGDAAYGAPAGSRAVVSDGSARSGRFGSLTIATARPQDQPWWIQVSLRIEPESARHTGIPQ